MAKKAKDDNPEPNTALNERLRKLTKAQLIKEVEALTDELNRLEPESDSFKEGYTADQGALRFIAEAKMVKQVKAPDLSQRYTILLETGHANILDLGKLPYSTLFEVSIGVSKEKLKT